MADTRLRTTGRRMAEAEVESPAANLPAMPSTERIQQELATAKNLDDFFGKEGIFARLFADTLGRFPTREEVAGTCEGRPWGDVVMGLLSIPPSATSATRLLCAMKFSRWVGSI